MAAYLKTCAECGVQFYARADAVYCGWPCRQKDWRRRQRDQREQREQQQQQAGTR
mgnify:CR=1 FL=1